MSDPAKSEQMVEELSNAEEISPTKTIDTLHNDEALRVLAGYTGDSDWAEGEEAKLRRKIDWKLMPILCMTYGLLYYDKAMLGQAVSLNDVQHSLAVS